MITQTRQQNVGPKQNIDGFVNGYEKRRSYGKQSMFCRWSDFMHQLYPKVELVGAEQGPSLRPVVIVNQNAILKNTLVQDCRWVKYHAKRLQSPLVATLKIYLSIITVYNLRGHEVLVINVCSPCSGSNVTRTIARDIPSTSSGSRVLNAIGSAVHSLRYQLLRERFRYDRDVFDGDVSPAENMNIAGLLRSPEYQGAPLQCKRNISARCLYHQLLDVKIKLTLGRLGYALRHGLSLQWSERFIRQAMCYTVQLATIIGQELPNIPCILSIQINSPRSRAELGNWILQALNENIRTLNNILLRSRSLLRVL